MFNKRIMSIVPESKKYIALNVLFQWVSLLSNICMMTCIASMIYQLYFSKKLILSYIPTVIICFILRFILNKCASQMSFDASKTVKLKIRELIYTKLLSLGSSYKEKVSSAEVVQVSVEGVEQLETYFGSYMPQFFYALIAPLTLFLYISRFSFISAFVLLICVPLIPMTIVIIQKWAKKLLSKYWGQYTGLGDTFLENLQGMTTLKIYQSDEFKAKEMAEQSEKFRKITMAVLTMQLNSVTVMDLVTYGGAGIGVILASVQVLHGNINLQQALIIILLSADFFLPMRVLGSYFHTAMNGMAACDKIFKIMDIKTEQRNKETSISSYSFNAENLCFSYDDQREILHSISFEICENQFIALVGESGCGKSTIASLLKGEYLNYTGSLKIGNLEIKDVDETALLKEITYISNHAYIFKGTVRENLLIAKNNASDEECWKVLEQTNLADFLHQENGLDTLLNERGSNFSGGQNQRLALARALLKNSPVYIFDEATSNVDVESENDIMSVIQELSKTKTVILISHRLANVVNCDCIYTLKNGEIVEKGTHFELMNISNGVYSTLFNQQLSLENFKREARL